MDSISVVTITEKDLEAHLRDCTARVSSVEVRVPSDATCEEGAPAMAALGGRRIAYRPMLALAGTGSVDSSRRPVRLVETLRGISGDDELFSDAEHRVLRLVRRSLQVHASLHQVYARAAGLDRLREQNREGRIPEGLVPELKRKGETAAAVSLFAAASYLLRRLGEGRDDGGSGSEVEVEAPPADLVGAGRRNADLLLWYLDRAIGRHARDDESLVEVTLACARKVCERVRSMRDSLEHLEFYTRSHYRIGEEGVTLAGFEDEAPRGVEVSEVVRKRPEDVVGNHLAKFEAMRIAQRLVCYDLERQRNPFVDLGGFSFSFIGDGSPGTGKTTLIQMTVSLLRDYCEALGLPFRYRNLSVDEISDYQGRSGQNAKRFCREVLDPRGIGFGTVDDVDQVCGNRADRNTSSGQLEVTAVLMQELAGPATVVRGNATFGLFSNYPEKVDDALRQRTQARFLVDGPRTREDFTDLMVLLLGPVARVEVGDGYEPFSSQKIRQVIRAKYEEHDTPSAPELQEIFRRHTRGGDIDTWVEFGEYLKALQEHDPRFTGRAVKNIAEAVRFRMMDFDLPPEWFEDRSLFFGLPYETRVSMLEELRGEVTPRMVLQEINRYADSEARYNRAASGRELERRRDQLVLDARARVAAREELAGAVDVPGGGEAR